jgi:hypothetical protein
MIVTVTSLTELVYRGLVVSRDRETADIDLAQLMRNIEDMIGTSRWREPIRWFTCAGCGAWLSSDLIALALSGQKGDDSLSCSECDSKEV